MATDVSNTQPEEAQAERTRTGIWFRPPVDIVEMKDELLLIADLPGDRATRSTSILKTVC